MSDMPESPEPAKKSLISLPFLIIMGVVLVGGIFGGPSIMTYVMYLQEGQKQSQNAVIKYEAGDDRPALGDPGAMGGGGGGPSMDDFGSGGGTGENSEGESGNSGSEEEAASEDAASEEAAAEDPGAE